VNYTRGDHDQLQTSLDEEAYAGSSTHILALQDEYESKLLKYLHKLLSDQGQVFLFSPTKLA